MDEARRLQALAAYRRRARAFEDIARRRLHGLPAALRPLPPAPAPASSRLSARGRQVLALLAEGYGNKEIAQRLQVGPETVKTHLRNVLVALNARNRAHAVAIALRAGLIGSGDEVEPAAGASSRGR